MRDYLLLRELEFVLKHRLEPEAFHVVMNGLYQHAKLCVCHAKDRFSCECGAQTFNAHEAHYRETYGHSTVTKNTKTARD